MEPLKYDKYDIIKYPKNDYFSNSKYDDGNYNNWKNK
jgi:hypothetical protein